jgi:hypothetical protein
MDSELLSDVRASLRKTFGDYATRGIRSALVRPDHVVMVLNALDDAERTIASLRSKMDRVHAALTDALASA